MSTTAPSTAPATPQPTRASGPGGRHPVVVGHLVMGLALLCFAAAWALAQTDTVEAGDVRWLLPVPWLVGGAAGLAVLTARSLRPGPAQPAGTPEDTDTQPDARPDLDQDLR